MRFFLSFELGSDQSTEARAGAPLQSHTTIRVDLQGQALRRCSMAGETLSRMNTIHRVLKVGRN